MPRQLRARTSRPNYASLAAIEELETGPPKPSFCEDADSGSDFAPNKLSPDDLQNDSEDFLEVDKEEAEEAPKRGKIQTPTAGSRPISHLHSTTRARPAHKPPPKSTSAPRAAKMYALPNPSIHHRHRAMPVFLRKEKVERLDAPPTLFDAPKIVSTNCMTSEQFLTDRISKAWGYNVGPGPVWNIMEDRSCFKEALEGEENAMNESFRRPRVHQGVEVKSGWTRLNERDTAKYFPTDTVLTDDGQLQPPAPVHCFLGPYGRQTRVEMAMFDSHATSEYNICLEVNLSCSMLDLLRGAQIGVRHIQMNDPSSYKHYLAIAPFPSRSHSPMIGAKVQRPIPACIQIWCLQPKQGNTSQTDHLPAGEVKCEMVLCFESGPAFEIKWCPLPSHDQWNEVHVGEHPRKLGLLAGTLKTCAVRALAWIRIPPTDGSGIPSISEDPTFLATGGYDGLECLTDIREPHGNVVNRTRDVINSTTYSSFAGGPIMIDHDNTVKVYSISPSTLGRGMYSWSLTDQCGASDYHAQLAIGSADGSCVTTNTLKSTRRGGSVPFFVHKIFQLDYSRKTGEFRMLDHFLPQETQERSTNLKGKQAKKDESETGISTGVWPPEVGVHRVTWNTGNGLGGAPLLASTTGSGLCRVDWLLGRWIRNKVPYVNVPNMRREVDDMMDEDSGDD
ncbi:hypothetical protein BDR07DRAFT_1492612 [Suillus spraguei]|nr:hypothetical protein BDR07DRAFT_1492612 [Suillus spraguei]